MNKKTALRLLQIQKDTISEYGKDYIWITQTLSLFRAFFGEDSHEYKMLKTFNHQGPSDDASNARLIRLIENAETTIKISGITTRAKVNYLHRISDTWLTTIVTCIITVILPATFYAGYWFGSHDKLTNTANNQTQKETTQPGSHDNNVKR